MNVEQIFYGRGDNGYDILASSVPSCGLTDQVTDLCRSVGTPGYEQDEDNKPFLLQKVAGPNVLMACGRNGDFDSMGRKTLFFHVLIMPIECVKEKRISAYDLYEAGLFSHKCHYGDLSSIAIETVTPFHNSECNVSFKLPAVVRCRRSWNMKLVNLFSRNLIATNWATMSWSLLDDFDWYGIDESRGLSCLPDKLFIYDIEGNLQRDAVEICNKHCCENPKGQDKAKNGFGMIKLLMCSVICLVVGFGIGRVVWVAPDHYCVDEAGIRAELETKIKAELTPKIFESARKSVRLEVEEVVRKEFSDKAAVKDQEKHNDGSRLVFNEKYRIDNFYEQMKKLDTTWEVAMIENKGDPSFKEARVIFNKLQSYVKFVNENFPVKKER